VEGDRFAVKIRVPRARNPFMERELQNQQAEDDPMQANLQAGISVGLGHGAGFHFKVSNLVALPPHKCHLKIDVLCHKAKSG
jgi:hypothetical protein